MLGNLQDEALTLPFLISHLLQYIQTQRIPLHQNSPQLLLKEQGTFSSVSQSLMGADLCSL